MTNSMTPQIPCQYGRDCPNDATVILHVDYPADAAGPGSKPFRYSKRTCADCASLEAHNMLAAVSTEPLQVTA